MSHLVKPTSFRAGKTQIWPFNTLLSTKRKLVNGNLTFSKSITRLSKKLLFRKRLYVVHGNVVDLINNNIIYNLIFMPRIKTKPREYSLGVFMRASIYKPLNLLKHAVMVEKYVDKRIDKIAKRRRKRKIRKLNRWLTRRMFRGAKRAIWKIRPIKTFKFFKRIYGLIPQNLLPLNGNRKFANFTRRRQPKFKKIKIYRKKAIKKIHKRQKLVVHWKSRWKYDKLVRRRFNDKKFSFIVSRILGKRIKIRCTNLFSYLASKKVVNFKTHQNHFWNFRYRRYRFQYKNYFDIINAFLTIGLIDHSEAFLLSILKVVLPLILKIRKFFRFMHKIIKYMPEIEEKYYVFKISITGKLAGGTKRTKFHSIGYGVLPVQTLDTQCVNNFLAYTHIYGEFGVKMLTAKHNTYISPAALT